MSATREIIDRWCTMDIARAHPSCPERALWAAVLWRSCLDLMAGSRCANRSYRTAKATSVIARVKQRRALRTEAKRAREWFDEPGDPRVVGTLAYVCHLLSIDMAPIIKTSRSPARLKRLYFRHGRLY